MAYDHRAGISNRSPLIDSEHRPSPWAHQDHHAHHRHTSSFHSIQVPVNHVMDPESEDSDISATGDDYSSSFSFPINLPPAPTKPALDNQDTIAAHLRELERVEVHNVKKHERLKEKRVRKDVRIARQRAEQDEKIKLIMDARARRDSRITQRRARENIAFQRFYEDLDEEETRLQTRLKRLKRGHLVEDPAGVNRRISMTSTSPSTPAYSTVPPPAKRHQTSHPAHAEASAPYTVPPTPHHPSYQFHPPPPVQHISTPYHPGPHYPPPSYGPSPPMLSHSRVGSNVKEGLPKTTNGQIRSPPVAAPAPMPISTSVPPPTSYTPTVSTPLPPRQSNATYDTRPPPPPLHPTSSFAAVNHPPSTGFAAVNSISSTAPAPASAPTPVQTPTIKEEQPRHTPRTEDQTPARANSADEKPAVGSAAANKRTPSTTHPYQMSEAFANRHHHCERTDSLNRGVWTWLGPHGSKDHPTSTPTEMYLVCNHDGCRRIDWRTVHGLQCHIVKNHEQPKGTIGSLEKALAAYGVPVREIEEFERQHGPGSGGTMADPKNAKVRKVKDLIDRRETSERESSVSGLGPFHLQKHPSYGSDSPHLTHVPPNMSGRKRSHSFDEQVPESGSENTPVDIHKLPQARSVSGFQAVNATWQGINATPSKPPQHREWQSHQPTVVDKVASPHLSQAPPLSAAATPFWSSWQTKNETVPNSLPQPMHIPASYAPIPSVPQPAPMSIAPVHSSEPQPTLTSTGTWPTPEQPKGKEVQQQPEQSGPAAQEVSPAVRTNEPTGEARVITVTDANSRQAEDAQPRPSSSGSILIKSVEVVSNDDAKNEIPGPRRHDEAIRDPQTPLRTPLQEDQTFSTRDDGKDTRSPELSHKRALPPRGDSRRSSMAATPFNKLGAERIRDDDVETNYTANTTSKAESVDDDSDSITVNLVPSADRRGDRDRESERTKTPVRLPNGRFSRTRRTRM